MSTPILAMLGSAELFVIAAMLTLLLAFAAAGVVIALAVLFTRQAKDVRQIESRLRSIEEALLKKSANPTS